MELQQPQNRYMRPPQPPPPADPNHHQPSVVPPPPALTWFSGQSQFHGHSPSPPPPNHYQQHWPPPPPPPPHDPYHAPPPYPAHHQYPPPPRPTPNQSYTPMPQSYPPQHSQEWHNSGWNQNQHLQHPALNNGEDWAAKAKAWAAAQTSVDNQYPQSQYAPSETSFSSGYVPEGHLPINCRNGSLVGDSNAALPHQESFPNQSYTPMPQSYHPQHSQEWHNSGWNQNQHLQHPGKEGNQNEQLYKPPWTFTSTSQQQAQPFEMEFQQPQNRYMRPPQPPPPADPNHHQPSVVPPPPAPTWFSGQFQFHGHSPSPPPPNHNQQHWPPPPPPPPHDHYHAPPPYPAHHQYPLPPPPPRPTPNQSYTPMPQSYPPQHSQEWHNSGWTFTSTSQQQAQPAAVGGIVSVEPPRDLSDQPLNFTSGFTRDHDQHVQSNPSAMASIHAWSSHVAPGVVYPPVHPPGPQNFQPMGPSVSVPFGGAGTYPGDCFGDSTVSDRPKKVKKVKTDENPDEQVLKTPDTDAYYKRKSSHHNDSGRHKKRSRRKHKRKRNRKPNSSERHRVRQNRIFSITEEIVSTSSPPAGHSDALFNMQTSWTNTVVVRMKNVRLS